MITIVEKKGSAPREVGTRMIVTRDQMHGTIGGGQLEFVALEQARKALDLVPGSWRVQDYPLGPLLGQCCGGRVKLLIERLDPASSVWLNEIAPDKMLETDLTADVTQRSVRAANSDATPHGDHDAVQPGWLRERLPAAPRPVVMFGAGHVGKAIADAAQGLPLSFTCFDTRPEFSNEDRFVLVGEDAAIQSAGAAGPEAAIVILTHDHGLDYRLTAAALASQACFVGLIGSATKRARFISRLRKDGIDAARLTCPIGLPEIPGKSPQVIAIAVLAQLLALEQPA